MGSSLHINYHFLYKNSLVLLKDNYAVTKPSISINCTEFILFLLPYFISLKQNFLFYVSFFYFKGAFSILDSSMNFILIYLSISFVHYICATFIGNCCLEALRMEQKNFAICSKPYVFNFFEHVSNGLFLYNVKTLTFQRFCFTQTDKVCSVNDFLTSRNIMYIFHDSCFRTLVVFATNRISRKLNIDTSDLIEFN